MYSNRDKRLDATICYDGTTYFTSPIEMDTKGNCYWENTQNHGFMTQSGYMWRKYIYELTVQMHFRDTRSFMIFVISYLDWGSLS